MSTLVAFDLANPGEPKHSKPAPDRLISGDPSYRTWENAAAGQTGIRTGIWEATPGVTRSIKGGTWEFCTILSGVVLLTEDGGETRRFTAGDTFVMRPDFVGTWETVETVRKVFVAVS
jgi:uncharacterized cupin superfamily protein